MKISRQIYTLLILFICNPAYSIEQAGNLRDQLKSFLDDESGALAEKGYRSEYKVGNIDPRLNLKPCTSDIDFAFNRQPISQNNVTVLASCEDVQPWKLYISVTFNIFGPVIIASETIHRGQIISPLQLEARDEVVNKHNHASFSDKAHIEGMIAKRSIRSGAIIQANQLKPPKLVKRGDNVVIVASNNAISVRMNGTALMDGSLGQQISVRNNQSERVVRARVNKTGLVTITL